MKITFAGSGDAFGAGGRLNTCVVIDAPGLRFALDFGASSLVALNKLGIPPNSIELILLTHFHGDHCAGVPALLVDAMLGAKRQTPITIAGPVETESRLKLACEALFPGAHVMKPKFGVNIIEMETLREHRIGALKVKTFPAVHTKETNPTSMRIEVSDKVIAYTGDSAWTEHMPELARGADLLISECYFYKKSVPFHMNYPDLKAHWDELAAKRIILTHLGPEMLAHADKIPEACAYDGLVVEI